MPKTYYFDHAAATPLDPGVLQAMKPFFADEFYNPSSQYLAAQAVKQKLESARAQVAQVVGVRPAEVTFTAGGTEANNLAIQGVAHHQPGSHIVVSAIEHDSILAPAAYLAGRGWLVSYAAPQDDGIVDAATVLSLITDETVLVSVMYANNELGTVQPIKAIAAGIQTIRKSRKDKGNTRPLYLHTDACQAANYLDLHLHRLGADMMTLNGGKIYGPKQSGALIITGQTQLEPLIRGGGQELNRRSGTENVPAIIGFGRALEQAQKDRKAEAERLKALQELFITGLQQHLPAAVVNGSLKHRLPNNVHITIPGADNERLLYGLDELGIQAAAGSACSASSDEPSHVLTAIGLTTEDAQASLRFSLGRDTSEEAIRAAVEALVKLA